MKETTRKTIEYLTTMEGKKHYRSALAHARSGGDRYEPIWDRFPTYALEDVHKEFGGGGLNGDNVMETFMQSTNQISPDGDPLYTSSLPRIIGVTKSFDKLATYLSDLLDDDEDSSWN